MRTSNRTRRNVLSPDSDDYHVDEVEELDEVEHVTDESTMESAVYERSDENEDTEKGTELEEITSHATGLARDFPPVRTNDYACYAFRTTFMDHGVNMSLSEYRHVAVALSFYVRTTVPVTPLTDNLADVQTVHTSSVGKFWYGQSASSNTTSPDQELLFRLLSTAWRDYLWRHQASNVAESIRLQNRSPNSAALAAAADRPVKAVTDKRGEKLITPAAH